MKYFKWMSLGGTIVSLGLMASMAGVKPQSLTMGAHFVRESVKELPLAGPRLEKALAPETPQDIWIDGKKYQANSKNVYNVDGVRSLVKTPPPPEAQEDRSDRGGGRLPTTTLGDKVLKNPLHAYTPEAMEELKRTLEEAQRQNKEKDATLQGLLED